MPRQRNPLHSSGLRRPRQRVELLGHLLPLTAHPLEKEVAKRLPHVVVKLFRFSLRASKMVVEKKRSPIRCCFWRAKNLKHTNWFMFRKTKSGPHSCGDDMFFLFCVKQIQDYILKVWKGGGVPSTFGVVSRSSSISPCGRVGSVYVFYITSICTHGVELLRHFTFHQKLQKISQ